mgnify:CR=1 FL=1|tara:strand:+ start:9754 stop:13272 length:3519 start_codon:yes stop_codon:yes gene_type:complete
MDTNALKKFAQAARNLLINQVSVRLDMVLAEGAVARREHPEAIARLEAAANRNRAHVIEQSAYTWFNRFTALRFMDVRGLTNPRVVSPADGATRPEILAEAMAGNLPDRARPEIAEYLNGTRPAHDGQAEAYRLLLIHACNEWHGSMPYMFERADMLDRAEDYTELLMPDDLLSPDSILARLREVMSEEACQDVEIIGWLYQFYISEKKDQVFAGLKKNVKITAENIPAATQLFTPHWIVRYLVENSLGRLWLLNRPQSGLAAKMDYYIVPEEPETDFLRIERPEDIRICDPACGSGHMLTYAFDLLYAIYEDEGYEASTIPALILTHNLTGIEIDDRAGALAAFALSMKAAAKLGRRRFLRMEEKPNIVVLQDVRFTPAEMQDVAAVVGHDLFTDELRATLMQFEQAKNFGSLIVPKLCDPAEALRVVEARAPGADLVLKPVLERAVTTLRMVEALSPKYHVVVANPPYLGKSGMNAKMGAWLKKQYPASWVDLYAAFIQRAILLNRPKTYAALVTMQGWMFLSTFEKLRTKLLSDASMSSMLHLGSRAFDSIGGEIVSTSAFVIKAFRSNGTSYFLDLTQGRSEKEKQVIIQEQRGTPYKANSEVFEKIPGSPIVYWLSESALRVFDRSTRLDEVSTPRAGMSSGDNPQFVRDWQEISISSFCRPPITKDAAKKTAYTWFSYLKGGDYRKWYGNQTSVVNWRGDGVDIKAFKKDRLEKGEINANNSKCWNEEMYFRENISWSKIASNNFAVRHAGIGHIASDASNGIYADSRTLLTQIGFLNSVVCRFFLRIFAPTINVQSGDLGRLPLLDFAVSNVPAEASLIAKSDWDAYETSWDFTTLPLLSPDHRGSGTLETIYAHLHAHWQGMTDEMQRLEEENNRLFIDAYGLQDVLTPEVPIEEITLTCNPAYRYGGNATTEELEARLLQDTMAEFLHYAVGCMLGRYSLDAPGLILANQGEGVEDYLARVPAPSFAPDRDNVIPVLDGDWFADDIVTRTRDFLRVTFGEATFRENLAFVEAALGKDLRRWFTKDFFDYHVRRYKKRPIYWMFSSPKGSFNALIYMHRYRPDTVSVVLNQYLREFIAKLEVERARLENLAEDSTATQSARTKAQKDIGTVIKRIAELTEWEREVIYPMAQQKIVIDLDNGVKRNYPLFAGALKPIKGLEAADG